MNNSSQINLYSVQNALTSLDHWLYRNGWSGFDPYDIKGTKLFRYLTKLGTDSPGHLKGFRKIIFKLEHDYPRMMRRIFCVKKSINPKGMGLFAQSYILLYQRSNDQRYKNKALFCLDWLLDNVSTGYSGKSWGYPHDWQTKILIPRLTPSAVVSKIVGDAFWSAYQNFGDPSYLESCIDICEFFVNDLNIDQINQDVICFSYTPLDDFHVHNANLMVAEFLARTGSEIHNDYYVDLGNKAANYALLEQNKDGSLYYWGGVQDHYNPKHIDHYHSGFEMRSLLGLWNTTNHQRYLIALRSYYDFYKKNLLQNINGDAIPRRTPNQTFPVDVHACTESILLNTVVVKIFPESLDLLNGVLNWTLKNMQTNEGWFIYEFNQNGRIISIPYHRWGQAWMMLALANTLAYFSSDC